MPTIVDHVCDIFFYRDGLGLSKSVEELKRLRSYTHQPIGIFPTALAEYSLYIESKLGYLYHDLIRTYLRRTRHNEGPRLLRCCVHLRSRHVSGLRQEGESGRQMYDLIHFISISIK